MENKTLLGVLVGCFVGIAFCTAVVTCHGGKSITVNSGEQSVDTVTVSGKSEVKVVPDKVSIQTGFVIEGTVVTKITDTLDNRVTALTERLKASGVKETDIMTEAYNVQPKYQWKEDRREQDGYTGSASVSVKGIDIADVNSILKLIIDAGTDAVYNISYYSSEYKESYDSALEQAIKEARAKAEKMGKAAGFVVKKVHELKEGNQNDSVAYVTNAVMEDTVAYGTEEGSVINPGELSIEAQVEVTYVVE